MPDITIRYATLDDIAIINHHRTAMFAEMAWGTEESRAVMQRNFARWLEDKLEQGAYIGWLACDDVQVVAGAGLWLKDRAPGPMGDVGPLGHVHNVYTEPEYRRQGLARKLMEAMIADCRDRSITYVSLHASDAARTLYESMGFEATNEMRLVWK